MPLALPRPAGVLRGPVPGEGRDAHRVRGARPAQVLAQDLFPEGGDYGFVTLFSLNFIHCDRILTEPSGVLVPRHFFISMPDSASPQSYLMVRSDVI